MYGCELEALWPTRSLGSRRISMFSHLACWSGSVRTLSISCVFCTTCYLDVCRASLNSSHFLEHGMIDDLRNASSYQYGIIIPSR